ncbi:MAG: YihY/virulence factor BrkB family protein [Salinisphaera sp.]|nr:YihY/virulence factor BrkB family protein [Salinisphaera sp.]
MQKNSESLQPVEMAKQQHGKNLAARARHANSWLWGQRIEQLPRLQRWAVTAARLAYVLVRDLFDGQLTMRAMGLVYTSLLSLVPLLALSFSLLKAFGIDSVLRPVLLRFLAPLGSGANKIADTVMGFVANVDVGVLGALGLGLLLYGVISLIQKVEDGCNYIWQVRRPRNLSRRFSEYLSVLIVGPLIVLTAISLTASVTSNAAVQWIASIEPFGTTLLLAGKLLPWFLYAAGFTFLFMFMPNTRVRLAPAFAGGVFSGVLWQTASLGFATFAGHATNVNAIYSSFALLIFLLIWLYVTWLILLLGCRVAFLLQHPEQLNRLPYPPRAGGAREETLALLVLALVGHNYVQGQPPWSVDRLARYLNAVPAHVFAIIDCLVTARILAETDADNASILPRRDIDRLTVHEVLEVIRRDDLEQPTQRDDAAHRRVADVRRRLQRAREEALDGMTVRELAEDGSALPASTARKIGQA